MTLPTIVNNLSEFRNVVNEIRDEEFQREFFVGKNVRAFFRGQENENWSLIPKLFRFGHSIDEIKNIERDMTNEFKNELKKNGLYSYIQEGFLKNYTFHSDWLFLEQSRHLGLATRFMDWTLDPQTALFFATLGCPDTNGKWFVLFPEDEWFAADRKQDTYGNIDPIEYNNCLCLNPSQFADEHYAKKFAERFKTRQNGRFLIQSIEDSASGCITRQKHFAGLIESLIIPGDKKAGIQLELEKEGLTRNWVYMEDDSEVVKVHGEIKQIINSLHNRYRL